MPDTLPPLPDVAASPPTRLIELRDGRVLAYAEWGDPNGFPTFYFHGTPSSRLEAAFAHSAAQRHGFRLIATDRPGFGLSSFHPRRRFRDWPNDILELAEALHISEFGVVGHSGAGPHLFACGAVLPETRLKFVGALGPWGPVATPEIMESLNRLDRFFFTLSRRLPGLVRIAFAPLGWCARYWPKLFFRLMHAAVSPSSKRALENPGFLAHFERIEAEAFRQGSRGGAHEAFIAFSEWDLDLSEVKAPTHIWLGKEDIFVPPTMGDYLKRNIPRVDFHAPPGTGHFNIDNWDDIFAACAAHVPARAGKAREPGETEGSPRGDESALAPGALHGSR